MPQSGDLNGLLASSDFYLYGAWSICRFTYLFARFGALFAISLFICKLSRFVCNFTYLFASSATLFAISLIYLQVQPLCLQFHLFICNFTNLFASSAALFAKLFSTQKKRHIHGTFIIRPRKTAGRRIPSIFPPIRVYNTGRGLFFRFLPDPPHNERQDHGWSLYRIGRR